MVPINLKVQFSVIKHWRKNLCQNSKAVIHKSSKLNMYFKLILEHFLVISALSEDNILSDSLKTCTFKFCSKILCLKTA